MNVELPPVDGVTAPWWAATEQRRLLLQHCRACGGVQHHPRALCTHCGCSEDLDWVTASGTARVDAFTVVHRAPSPGLDVPYIVARVRLAEGPMMLTNLVGPAPADWFEVDLELDWRPLSDGRNLPVFKASTHPPTHAQE